MSYQKSTISVPLFGQKTDEWCWAASSRMIMQSIDGEGAPEQCAQASFCFNLDNCCNNPTPNDCVKPNYYTASQWQNFGENTTEQAYKGMVENLNHWGYTTNYQTGQPTFAQVQAQVDAGQAFLFSWAWLPLGRGGHAMVVVGYVHQEADVNGQIMDVKLVQINDPWGPDRSTSPHPGDTGWYTYAMWLGEQHDVRGQKTVDEENKVTDQQTVEEEKAVGVSTHHDETLWHPHQFTGYIADITYSNLSSFSDSGGGVPIGASPEGQGTAAGSGHVSHDSLDSILNVGLNLLSSLEKNVDSDAELTLGVPLPVHYISLDKLQAYDSEQDAAELLHDGKELIYPVYQGDTVVSSIVVVNSGSRWYLKQLGRVNLTNTLVVTRAINMEKTGLSAEDYFVLYIPSIYHIFIAYQDESGQLQIIHTRYYEKFGFVEDDTQSIDEIVDALSQHAKGIDRPEGMLG